MKLLTKYNRANIITAIIILLATSVSFYLIIKTILLQQLDKDLKVEEQEIIEFVKEHNSLPNASAYKGQVIKFEVAKSGVIKREIKTISINNRAKDEDEPVRMLSFPVEVNGVLNKAIVIKSQVEAEDLLAVIVSVTGAIILLLLIIISLINRFLLAKLWQPFYDTLQQLRSFDLKTTKQLELKQSEVDEFNELNASVSEMTKRVNHEFEALKAFTDNASHEIQTPLAIINSKLDILLQTSTEKQSEQIQSIYNATNRLTRLNHTLLLLTKINNKQYENQSTVNLTMLLEQKLQQFDELIKGRNIQLSSQIEQVNVRINEELAEILLNNLLSNAVKHNYDGGYIKCMLSIEKFTIVNSGPSLTFEQKHLFERFQKSNHSNGTGLGLSVVQQICESSGFTIEYSYYNKEHSFSTIFYKSI